VVSTAGRYVDRQVAEQPHAMLGGVAAQRRPLPLETDLVGNRALARVRRPCADPVKMSYDERFDLSRRHQGVGPRQQT
jgi:hypothetical protein